LFPASAHSDPESEERSELNSNFRLADQPICYGVEITEYPVVSGQSAGSAEGIGLEGQQLLK
jgi:hypothetical protein